MKLKSCLWFGIKFISKKNISRYLQSNNKDQVKIVNKKKIISKNLKKPEPL